MVFLSKVMNSILRALPSGLHESNSMGGVENR